MVSPAAYGAGCLKVKDGNKIYCEFTIRPTHRPTENKEFFHSAIS